MSPGSSKKRLLWVDDGKGISILGVVLLHSLLYTPQELRSSFLFSVSDGLDNIRIPLFFLLSGLFAYKVAHYSFKELFKNRIWFLLVPYLVWGSLTYVVQRLINGESLSLSAWSLYLVQPSNGIWFLYGLMLASIIAWCGRKLPQQLMMFYTAMIPFTLTLVPLISDVWSWRRICLYIPFFFIGLYHREIILNFSKHKMTISFVSLFAAMGFIAALLGNFVKNTLYNNFSLTVNSEKTIASAENIQAWGSSVVSYIVYLSFIPITLLILVLVGKVPYLNTGLTWFGQRTLPLYLTNEISLSLWQKFISPALTGITGDFFSSHTTFYGLLTFLFAIGVGASLNALSETPYFKYLFTPPRLP